MTYHHVLSDLDRLDLFFNHHNFIAVSIKVVSRIENRIVLSDP